MPASSPTSSRPPAGIGVRGERASSRSLSVQKTCCERLRRGIRRDAEPRCFGAHWSMMRWPLPHLVRAGSSTLSSVAREAEPRMQPSRPAGDLERARDLVAARSLSCDHRIASGSERAGASYGPVGRGTLMLVLSFVLARVDAARRIPLFSASGRLCLETCVHWRSRRSERARWSERCDIGGPSFSSSSGRVDRLRGASCLTFSAAGQGVGASATSPRTKARSVASG